MSCLIVRGCLIDSEMRGLATPVSGFFVTAPQIMKWKQL